MKIIMKYLLWFYIEKYNNLNRVINSCIFLIFCELYIDVIEVIVVGFKLYGRFLFFEGWIIYDEDFIKK